MFVHTICAIHADEFAIILIHELNIEHYSSYIHRILKKTISIR